MCTVMDSTEVHMMLRLYRRHLPTCKHLAEALKNSQCSRPICRSAAAYSRSGKFNFCCLRWS